MNTNDLIKQLELLLQEEITENTSSKLDAIHHQYYALQKTTVATANIDKGATDESEPIEIVPSDEEIKYKQLYTDAKASIEKYVIAKATNENNNLIAKREIIVQLKELAESQMDSLGDSFKKFNELKDKWRTIGNVPEKHYIALQRDYRFYNEQFFYTIKIFKDLQEHDLKKNGILKNEIIEKLQKLSTLENIKELESGVKSLQNEWDEIGPTIDTEWEKLRDSFKELLNTIYQKIQAHHHAIYESMSKNLELKNELIERISALDTSNFISPKQWEDATKLVLSTQEAYKKIGFAKKKENEDSWIKFRELCNSFFDNKKEYYNALKSKNDIGKNAKEFLIKKAEELSKSIEWNITTPKILALQKEWKEAPSAGHITDNKLWEAFRTHCDFFFNAKKQNYESLIQTEQENLSKKLQLITRIQGFSSVGELPKDLAQIQAFKDEWNSIGFVPKAEKDKVTKLYNDAIQDTLKKLNVSEGQLNEIKFNSMVDNIKNNPEASQLAKAEKMKLKEELNKLENSISQKENNLLFFAKSKNANSMLDDVKKQLENEKAQAQILKDKIKKLVF
jgi:hypothetical protein